MASLAAAVVVAPMVVAAVVVATVICTMVPHICTVVRPTCTMVVAPRAAVVLWLVVVPGNPELFLVATPAAGTICTVVRPTCTIAPATCTVPAGGQARSISSVATVGPETPVGARSETLAHDTWCGIMAPAPRPFQPLVHHVPRPLWGYRGQGHGL